MSESETDDPACLAALEAKLGHAPPFSDEELASLTSLTITHARDLSAIAGCTGLEHLRIVASELEDLLALEALSSLAHLEIVCTRLGGIMGVDYSKLGRVDVLFSSMEDATDLFAVPIGWYGIVVGNPWNDTSWSALTTGSEHRNYLIDCGSPDEREDCRALWGRLGACSGELAGDYGLIVRPGIPKLTKNTYDAIHVPTSVARIAVRNPEMTLEKLFSEPEYAHAIEAPDLCELAASRVLGWSAAAKQWIASSTLSADDKAALDAFVTRFPTIPYFRVTDAAVSRAEKAFELRLPDGYRELRKTLDGWWPLFKCPPVRFDRFEGSSPRGDEVSSKTYSLGLREHGDDERETMLKAGFVAVGWSIEFPQSTLAIRLDGDPSVFEYSSDDIQDAMSEGRDVTTSIYPVFRSYAAMLGHVVSIHPPDHVVRAKMD